MIIAYDTISVVMKYRPGYLLILLLLPMVLTAVPVHAQLAEFNVQKEGIVSGKELEPAIRKIINVFLMLVATIAVIVLIYAGVRYIISLGNEDEAERAKRMILYAVIGLIVVGLSAVIVNFTLDAVGVGGGGGDKNGE